MNIRFVTSLVLSAVLLAGCNDPAATPDSSAPRTQSGIDQATARLPRPWNTGDYRAGAVAYAKCRNCHAIDADATSPIGPNLYDMFNRAPAAVPGYGYSPAMIEFAKSATFANWTPEELDKWLADPQVYLPNSGMFFDGLADTFERRNLIAYLMIEAGGVGSKPGP